MSWFLPIPARWNGRGSLYRPSLHEEKPAQPVFLAMLRDIFRFNKAAAPTMRPACRGTNIGRMAGPLRLFKIISQSLSPAHGRRNLVDTGIQNRSVPARSFLHFFYNHRLIHDRPQWRTVRGGSREYVKKLSAATAAQTILNAQVTSVERRDNRVLFKPTGKKKRLIRWFLQPIPIRHWRRSPMPAGGARHFVCRALSAQSGLSALRRPADAQAPQCLVGVGPSDRGQLSQGGKPSVIDEPVAKPRPENRFS